MAICGRRKEAACFWTALISSTQANATCRYCWCWYTAGSHCWAACGGAHRPDPATEPQEPSGLGKPVSINCVIPMLKLLRPSSRRQALACGGLTLGLLLVAALVAYLARSTSYPRQFGHFPLTEAWTYQADGQITAVSASAIGVVFVRTPAQLTALDAHTGQMLWQADISAGIYASDVLVDQGVAYVSNDRGVWALDELTGERRWTNTLVPHGNGDAQVIAATACCVVVNRLATDLTVYDPSSGAALWSIPSGRGFPTAHLADKTLYLADAYGLRAFEAATGELFWLEDVGPVGASAYKDGTIFFSQNGQRTGPRVAAFDVSKRSHLWSATITGEDLEEVQVIGEVVYVTAEQHLYAHEVSTGQRLWQTGYSQGGKVHRVGDAIYVHEWINQRLSGIDSETGKELGSVIYSLPHLFRPYQSYTAQLQECLFVATGRELHAYSAP
jgi:outer membrane protein assembly factor BamB